MREELWGKRRRFAEKIRTGHRSDQRADVGHERELARAEKSLEFGQTGMQAITPPVGRARGDWQQRSGREREILASGCIRGVV